MEANCLIHNRFVIIIAWTENVYIWHISINSYCVMMCYSIEVEKEFHRIHSTCTSNSLWMILRCDSKVLLTFKLVKLTLCELRIYFQIWTLFDLFAFKKKVSLNIYAWILHELNCRWWQDRVKPRSRWLEPNMVILVSNVGNFIELSGSRKFREIHIISASLQQSLSFSKSNLFDQSTL